MERDAAERRLTDMRPIVAVLALAIAVTGCSSARAPARPAAGAHRGGAGTPARRPPAPLSARVVLPSRTMRAGTQMPAHVVVENNTGHAIHAGGCGSLFQVDLVSRHYHPLVVWLTCLQSFTIPVGVSRYRVIVIASYSHCAQGRPQPGMKSCLRHGGAPPLPPGEYHATLFQSGHLVPAPPAIAVRVTPAAPAP